MSATAPNEGFAVIDANPLYGFRAPKRLRANHSPTHGDHFITQKADVINDTGILNIYPGYFRLRSNAQQELDFKVWEDVDDTRGESMAQYLRLTTQEGFTEALAKDFDIQFRIRQVWKKDTGGRLTLGGKTKPAFVLMYRTGEEAAAREAERLRRMPDIHTSVEQKAAATGREWAEQVPGAEVTNVSIEEGEGDTIQLKEER